MEPSFVILGRTSLGNESDNRIRGAINVETGLGKSASRNQSLEISILNRLFKPLLKLFSKSTLEISFETALETGLEIASEAGTVNFHNPPGHARFSRRVPTNPVNGWRAGRNPPSVPAASV